MDKNVMKISVRNLVEFILRKGDLVSTFTGSMRMKDAIMAHQKIQKLGSKEYSPEVTLSIMVERYDINIKISGRADGIIKNKSKVVIDEIKTTTNDLEFIKEDYNELHWAQAKCYGYMYSIQNKIENIEVQLTYYQMDTKQIKRFVRSYSISELEKFFYSIVEKYLKWASIIKSHNEKKEESIKKLKFPFGKYRKGQRKLAVYVYKTIEEGKVIFIKAPTGIGKTLATLFPSIKAMNEKFITKIFYLTPKTITRTAAEQAINTMRTSGLVLKSITLTAKDKICFKDERNCGSENCEYAKGYFDRINKAILDIFKEDEFSKEVIEKYAREHKVCPFEFSLELVNYSDCVICDYNYIFDPRVRLKGFIEEKGKESVFLIDEAHNLVDRARDMFSSQLSKKDILSLKKSSKTKSNEIYKKMNKLNSLMIQVRKKCENQGNKYVEKDPPKDISKVLRETIYIIEKWLLENKNDEGNFKEEILEFYFNALSFLRTYEGYDERYVTYGEKIFHDTKIKLFCLDPSNLLREVINKGKSTLMFSATLSPMDYFIDILGGDNTTYRTKLKSPFKSENLCILMDKSISTKYSMREFTYDKVVQDIEDVIKIKKGNYMVFLPSYKYMEEIYARFCDKNKDVDTILQHPKMNEEEKEDFLRKFSMDNKDTLVGFAVMGGMFSEGIDLVQDRLIGSVIVGTGLPQLCFERDIISDYFKNKKNKGFQYAYMYPGMNKVMQSAGRVIRTEKDRGIVLLIDERFSHFNYRKLFPIEWKHIIICKNSREIKYNIKQFWEKEN